MSIIASLCNQPSRLGEALVPVRADLVVPGPLSRWGMGYVRGGEILLSRTPRPSETALDFFPQFVEHKADCILANASHDGDVLPTESTQPFRFRRWMFAQDGAPTLHADDWHAIAAQIPDFLRRNLRGRTAAELTLHTFLATLHDQNALDEQQSPGVIKRALAETLERMDARLRALARPIATGNIAVSNSRSLTVARVEGGAPLFIRRLHVFNERGARDDSFRGVLALSSSSPPGEGAEEIPVGSLVTISRDLRVDIAPLGAV